MTKTCRQCGEALNGRSDKEYCGDACRKAFDRHAEQTRSELPPDQLSEDGTIRTSYGWCSTHDLRFSTTYLRVPGESPAVWHGAGGGCSFCSQEAAIQRDAEARASLRMKTPEVQAELKRLAAEALSAYEQQMATDVESAIVDYVAAIRPGVEQTIRSTYAERVYADVEASVQEQFLREALAPEVTK